MNSEIYYEYFEMVIEELITCMYCESTNLSEEKELCKGCELSLELTEALIAMAEA